MNKNFISLLDEITPEIKPANKKYLSDMIEKIIYSSSPYPVNIKNWDYINVKRDQNNTSVMVLPGSFLDIGYLDMFCNHLSHKGFSVSGLNYPLHMKNQKIEDLNNLSLADYVHSAYDLIYNISNESKSDLYLLGHSLGTIIIQMILLIRYAAEKTKMKSVKGLKGAIFMGGGPPKIGIKEIISTIIKRSNTIPVIMQMTGNPVKFSGIDGMMKKTLGSESNYEYLNNNGLIYCESKKVMKECFIGNDYHYIPGYLIEKMNLRTLFVYGKKDLFVTPEISLKAASQWKAQCLEFDLDHTDLVIDKSGLKTADLISDWINCQEEKQ